MPATRAATACRGTACSNRLERQRHSTTDSGTLTCKSRDLQGFSRRPQYQCQRREILTPQ